MKIKMLINIGGRVSSGRGGSDYYTNVRRGDVVDFDDAEALRYIANGYAQADWKAAPGPVVDIDIARQRFIREYGTTPWVVTPSA